MPSADQAPVKPAFDNAMALVGCPDLRIDRICITCCSPLPTFTSRRLTDAILLSRQRGRFLVALALGNHRQAKDPHSVPLCIERSARHTACLASGTSIMRDRFTLRGVVAALAAAIVTMGIGAYLVRLSSVYSYPFGQLAATTIAGALFGVVVSVLRRRVARETLGNVLLGGFVGMGYCVALWLLYLAPPVGLLIILGLFVGVPIYIAKSRPTWSCVLLDWV